MRVLVLSWGIWKLTRTNAEWNMEIRAEGRGNEHRKTHRAHHTSPRVNVRWVPVGLLGSDRGKTNGWILLKMQVALHWMDRSMDITRKISPKIHPSMVLFGRLMEFTGKDGNWAIKVYEISRMFVDRWLEIQSIR